MFIYQSGMLPYDILELVLNESIKHSLRTIKQCKSRQNLKQHIQSIILLSTTCRSFSQILEKQNWSLQVIQNLPKHFNLIFDNKQISEKRAISLIINSYCECCNKQNVSTIIWQFCARWCTDCINKKTITWHQLQKNKIPYEVVQDLPYFPLSKFTGFVSMDMDRYLIESVLQELKQKNPNIVHLFR